VITPRVRRFIAQHALIAPESRVVAAVSGGSDSMALLQVLHDLDRLHEVQLAGVAHFNHRLRAAADDDERFVTTSAAALGVTCVTDREDVAARAKREGRSREDAARTARHEFLARARATLGADLVAVGHTRDDQAETLLLRLLRGAGPRGLSGMHPRSGFVVRPLLDCRRDELKTWLADRRARGVPACDYVTDETNADVSIPRNRVRLELVPFLQARFNPSIVETLANEAALLRDVWTWMEEAGAPFRQTPHELDIAALNRLPLAFGHLVVWQAMTAASGGRQVSNDHVAAVIRLMQAGDDADGKGIDAPGHHVQRIGGRIVLLGRAGSPGSGGSRGAHGAQSSQSSATANSPHHPNHPNLAHPANLFRFELSIPGEVLVEPAGCVVSADDSGAGGASADPSATAGNGAVALVRRDRLQGSLVVRNRRPGDRFRPVGLNGSKKLQDLFVDRKLARDARDQVPLVVDETDRIVWVAGYGIDEAFRVTDPSQAVLVLRLTRA
jgi:tRNA(Ile)-lysidine synthase